MTSPDTQPRLVVHGGPAPLPTLLGQGPLRLPTGGRIRAGIKVLTRQAAESAEAQAIYDRGLAEGRSFDQIERALAEALPRLKTPLIPRNVPWFTVRPQDFPNPELAQQILTLHGEDRGEGLRLYRFPVIFPTDRWQTVMPHELATWGAHDKRYWSAYAADGRTRQCMTHAPVPVDDTGRRTIRLFGGRKSIPRPDNGGLCQPEGCREYQQRQCNLSGRFIFFIPGIRSVSAFELHTASFYAMNAAIQTFEAVAFLRGGRIAGFLDRQRTPFYLSKRLLEVAHIDEQARSVRVPQWIISLEAPVDVSSLLREHEDTETALMQAEFAAGVLDGEGRAEDSAGSVGACGDAVGQDDPPAPGARGEPDLAKIVDAAQALGVDPAHFLAYAQQRWGAGWKLNPQGRQRAWAELERYRNDPAGYVDKVEAIVEGAS
ncbi:MAG: hypothetical protein JNM26_17355 [Ideonella sp.]|jgi:hypothetical protein|nr:hypothetical protein [Ideonella sp.]